ncbi:hypothetical protein BAUCODRAFT_153681 [Baudoinia panamericana UAMH 10762]|uniref:Telomere-associated protein Rif1 N-terminal domain-containing protein n=1 Tax=Baudoinia panamericana (strain UAMH 10762) TaxID=717646 RepID=M2N643_BAUPA|nr:uncharacterized protein BAUCODRAFT_153681 [Baudoinia panamericana UAMH 10762]EMC99498.1 hypothetical protein BAUCODRAFT_153681 [Baudoinia panamericana UAMH 10762]
MVSSMSSAFDSLPTRPPTPPRDHAEPVSENIRSVDDGNEVQQGLTRLPEGSNLQADASASATSPPSSQEPPGSVNAKRVGFSPSLTYHRIAAGGDASSPNAHLRKRKPLRKDAQPPRSILKASALPPPSTPDEVEVKLSYFSPEEPGSFARMLQSIFQQLASPSVSARLDAYLALNGTLQAYGGVPDSQAISARMSLLVQFLTRDMAWKNHKGELSVNIVTQALKLTATMMFNSTLLEAMDYDFRTFIIDRCVTVVETVGMPKALVKSHMYMLAQQRFQSSVITPTRADRIISAVLTVEERCSGSSIIATRLAVYQRLLDQAPLSMLHRMRDWFEHVIHGMLSTIKDIRDHAISTCMLAGHVLGTHSRASRTVLELLQSEINEGKTFCDYIIEQLMQMISQAEMGAYVPQIWSTIILFFRNKQFTLERWSDFKAWLKPIQRCLNSNNVGVRYQAYLAWNKLVFATMPDASTSRKMLEMLQVPITTGMDRSPRDAFARQARQWALESYYTVLYYTLRPGLTHSEVDTAWDVFVQPVLAGMIKANVDGRRTASGVIASLCSTYPGMWNATAVSESKAIMTEDLPGLDPKWVRSRLARVMNVVEQLLGYSLANPVEATNVQQMWRCIMRSVGAAGTQEIRSSSDLKQAIALIVNALRRFWDSANQTRPAAESGPLITYFTTLAEIAAEGVGTARMTEDVLLIAPDSQVQAITTPSHRASKHQSAPQCALALIFDRLQASPATLESFSAIETAANTLLELLTSTRRSACGRVELLARITKSRGSIHASHASAGVASILWICVAQSASTIMERLACEADNSEPCSLGIELRHASAILAEGLLHLSHSSEVAERVYDAVFRLLKSTRLVATKKARSAGVVVAVLEPFAAAMREIASPMGLAVRLRLTSDLMTPATWANSKQEFEKAKRVLWGVGLAPNSVGPFSPYVSLYEVIDSAMQDAYDQLESLVHDMEALSTVGMLLRSALAFLQACPKSLLVGAVEKLQRCLATWIEDRERKTAPYRQLIDSVCLAGHGVLQLIESFTRTGSVLIKALEPLLLASMLSPHKVMVNDTVRFWNRTFGEQTVLEYPENLAKVLYQRSREADIALPGFPDSLSGQQETALPAFYESQPEVSPSKRFTLSDAQIFSSDSRRQAITTFEPETTRSSPSKRHPSCGPNVLLDDVRRSATIKPPLRPRHDDSQIEFAPVESLSPMPQNESHMLTERQKEVKRKQQELAPLFPELSSSPMMNQASTNNDPHKVLDFHTEVNPARSSTPDDLPDADALSSDDLPSSPTPSSAKDVESAAVEANDNEGVVDGDTEGEWSSSPPRQSAAHQEERLSSPSPLNERLHSELVNARIPTKDVSPEKVPSNAYHASRAVPDKDLSHVVELDDALVSDSVLPNAQLEREAQEAANSMGDIEAGQTAEVTMSLLPPLSESDQAAAAEVVAIALVDADTTVEDAAANDVSRVQDSFVQTPEGLKASLVQHASESQESRQNSRKRKRTSSAGSTARKRMSTSPIKKALGFFSSYIAGRRQDEEDEDRGEEIVVASSQPRSPPQADAEPSKPSSPLVVIPVTSFVDSTAASPGTAAVLDRPKKRGPGRPRTSEASSPANQRSKQAMPKTLKRRASALSDDNDHDDEKDTESIGAKPTPSEGRRQRQRRDTELRQVASRSQDDSPARNLRSRSTGSRQASNELALQEQDHCADDAITTPQKQHQSEASVALQPVSPSTPKTILERLREVLGELQKAVLGPREEREMDDVLYELRRESHEAARRGRQRTDSLS